MRSANERRRYIVTLSLIGWVHTWNDACKPALPGEYFDDKIKSGKFYGSSSAHSWSKTCDSPILKTQLTNNHYIPILWPQKQVK